VRCFCGEGGATGIVELEDGEKSLFVTNVEKAAMMQI
jgi:hypothetical protein